ncbi:hypothetical protein EVB81_166 [Rhizobium phage RHph_I46]|uniref:Uncharacterized protein n=1 Tax=Rhizobium phage RHph_I1_9 TaxID=2509729 RepID=A0A7S5R9J0_9CAUD|nr:hypothetical protein PP936_gp165 [Rhizobium phage RHph_I1_9]QIG69735.1 hypothetical protein EVB81_166 [Rhizobium phage RHph_I46]QIG71016.1 hypothetical protein EVB92_166 [Rhizobium phage RHph_I9]QIG73602.1 hypothetical protein EVC04_165 [Rhizobium phage RHph_I1_9]QIG76355.1 hypothetical protein EVC25_166 [Rhizobium phage RHph_I34]
MLDKEDARYTLCAARELIASKGRAKGSYEDANGCYCTVGAICKTKEPKVRPGGSYFDVETQRHISYSSVMDRNEIRPIIVHLATVNGMDQPEYIFLKNDSTDTEGVLEMFDKAIAAL